MTRKLYTQETLQAALDLVARGITRPTAIARGIGVSYDALCQWLVRSNNDDPEFLVTYNSEEMQFARAYSLAKRLAMLELRGMLEQRSIFGHDEISHEKGQVVWAIDPKAAAIDDPEIRVMCGYRRDALLEIDGALQPVRIHHQAPIGLSLRLLEAAFRDMRPGVVQEVRMSGNVAVGVALRPRVDYSQAPPPVPPPPPIPQLSAPEDADFRDANEDDLDIVDAEDDDAPIEQPSAPVNVVVAPLVEIAPEPVIKEAPPPEYTPPQPKAPLSPLARDLLARARAAPGSPERTKPI